MSDVSLQVNTEKFENWSEQYLVATKRELEPFMQQQMKGIVRTIISITPPGSKGVTGSRAKARGVTAVRADAFRVVVGVPRSQAQTDDVSGVIARARDAKGRVKRKQNPLVRVPSAALTSYLKETTGKVGSLAGGWNAAAGKLGYKPPAWIWRHNSPGRIDIDFTDKRLRIVARNRVRFATGVSGLTRRVQFAVDSQGEALRSQTNAILVKQSQKAGLKNSK
jgi:hypothetical protein